MPGLRAYQMRVSVTLFAFVMSNLVLAQPAAGPAGFDVVSVRRNNTSSTFAANPPLRGGRLKWANVTLSEMLTVAYPVDLLHIRGGPGWADEENYDVEAISTESSVSDQRYRQMVQAMLADRFQLTTHFEQRQETVYYLSIDKKGLRLKKTTDGTCVPVTPDKPLPPADRACGRYPVTQRQHFEGIGMKMAKLAEVLTFVVGSPVIDRTGLAGMFDVRLDYAPPDDPSLDGPPSIFTALPDQLGLRLEPAKGPVNVLVIDHVARPSAN
jgi:uncharacterized protein (TIGR03435 family)